MLRLNFRPPAMSMRMVILSGPGLLSRADLFDSFRNSAWGKCSRRHPAGGIWIWRGSISHSISLASFSLKGEEGWCSLWCPSAYL